NYGVICEDKAKRRNSGTKMKTFEENSYLLTYVVSSNEDTAYQCQLITRVHCMTRSSAKELLSPFENPEQKFRSKRRLFVESNSPEFDQISDIEEHIEEEVT
ncbi:hypothetical protein Tco_0788935, partial [Tanacetum coccineum]